MSRLALGALLVIACASGAPEAVADGGPQAAASDPRTMLWVWHGAHDLRGLPPSIGVAYLARTLRIGPDGRIGVVRRGGALVLDDATTRWAVVHVELGAGTRAPALDAARARLVAELREVASEPDVSALQIDFDAPSSFHAAYAGLLHEARTVLASDQRLSMTALGAWCISERWLDATEVDVVVPMMFGPGHDEPRLRSRIAAGPLPEPRCRDAIGIREGEAVHAAAQVFVFPIAPWTMDRALATDR